MNQLNDAIPCTTHTTMPPTPYIGRFAPSPSGELHMGSLICALASYLDARAHNGTWLIRIEDIDPPREQTGASEAILHSLSAHGLVSDAPPLYQSEQSSLYQYGLEKLAEHHLLYPCNCTRARTSQLAHHYDQHCLHSPPPSTATCALRFNAARSAQQSQIPSLVFTDPLQGQNTQASKEIDDFILKRKDGLFAYQLAVVMDDIAQQITHIVRGADLFETTHKYLLLDHTLRPLLASETSIKPQFMHIPVLLDENEKKMSKQNHAKPLNLNTPVENLFFALQFLGFDVTTAPLKPTINTLLSWASQHWHGSIKKLAGIKTKKASFASPERNL